MPNAFEPLRVDGFSNFLAKCIGHTQVSVEFLHFQLLGFRGYAPGFVGMVKGSPFVKKVQYLASSINIPMCPCEPPPFVVGIVAAHSVSLLTF